MIEKLIETEGVKNDIVNELKTIGLCDLCTLRYLGVKDAIIYKERDKLVMNSILGTQEKEQESNNVSEAVGTEAKCSKKNPCVACLGLLQECIEDPCLVQIAKEIKEADIEASSYAPMLTLPISMQIRAYSIWFHLIDKFPQVYKSLPLMKPEGVKLKSVWKWICTMDLKRKVDSNSEWMTNGDLVINMVLNYKDDNSECLPMFKLMRQKNKKAELTRGTADSAFLSMDSEHFHNNFTCPPSIPTNSLVFDKISCSHMAVFVAGRYCKYSRDVSQSPWLNADGTRLRGEGSVQEFITEHVAPIFNCDSIRFSSSGREDSDVRMLGKGRPFVLEIVNPKKTIFTQKRIKLLQSKINESTNLISVRDLQMVEKKDLAKLRDGEEIKNKMYTALCQTPGREVTKEALQILNDIKTPLVLHQNTPLRVLHRRSLIDRSRSILSISAEPAKRSKEMFILHLKTEAGTYVKEFVHGDFGRTDPSVSSLLNYPTEILSLDVADVEFDWPPEID